MDNRVVSETTPLFHTQRQPSDATHLVPVLPIVQSLDHIDLTHLHWEDLAPRPVPSSLESNECRRLAFALIVLLELRKQKISWKTISTDLYEQWVEEETRARDVDILEAKVNEVWENFLAQYHGSRELYDVFWTGFPLAHDIPTLIRVADFLSELNAPQKFVAHPMVSATMAHTWRFGRPNGNSTRNWLSKCFGPDIVPSKMHLLEMLFDLASLLVLLNYIIHPPNWPDSDSKKQINVLSCGIREVYVVVHAFSALISGRRATVLVSSLILFAFLLSLPSLPLPGSLPFYILLWVILFRLLMHHTPIVLPGPLLLLAHQRSLPLAVFLYQGLSRIIQPLSSFYLPIIILSCFALSTSLSGPLTLASIPSFQISTFLAGPYPPIIGAAPMDTRVALFLFFILVLLITLSSASILASRPVIPQSASRSLSLSNSLQWDFYSTEVGHAARIASYRATSIYNSEYYFPQPFNLVELFFVVIPVGLSRLIASHPVERATVAKPIWNITVRPFVTAIALLSWPLP